ncbi:bifunctional metallophosphatase/5'-nucleotidase [Vagococcus sp. JNUCC 83]
MKEVIHLLHTNDIHSHLEKWPKIRRWIKDQTTDFMTTQTSVFTFDIGDFMDRVHPLTEATNGVANVELMNQVHYDAVTIGNNEGITNSKNVLNRLYQEANFPIVLSNLLDRQTNHYPSWAKPYIILTSCEGTKIGIFGLTAPMELSYFPFGWQVLNPYKCAKEMVAELSEKVDVIILLSHLGINDDKKMAQEFPEIDVILGSHTHHLLPEGLIENGVLLCAAGRFGEYVGDVTLELTNSIITKKIATTTAVDSLKEHISDEQEVSQFMIKGNQLLKETKVATLAEKLTKEDTLILTTLKAMKKSSGCDVSMINSGLFLTDLGPGEINAKDIHTSLPHPMNLIKVTLKGRDLLRLAKEVIKNRDFLRKFPIVGMKFRGKYFGEVWYDGFTYDETLNQGYWLNQPIYLDKQYSFVTVDHLAFVPFFPTIEIAGDIEILGPKFLRNYLSEYLGQ